MHNDSPVQEWMLPGKPMREIYTNIKLPAVMSNSTPTRWEIRYWISPDLSGPPQKESFASPEEARARREEMIAKGHPTHLRLFSCQDDHG